MKLSKYLIVGIVFSALNSHAQNCPTPPTSIDIKIDSSYSYDKKQQDYTYTYRISNSRIAKSSIYMIKIESEQAMVPVQMPVKWSSSFQSINEGFNPSVVDIMSGFDEIKPGSGPLEFKFKSKLGPGIVKFYAEGSSSDQLKAVSLNGDDEAAPICPGFFMDEPSILNQMVTGTTIGPVSSKQIDARIKMKVLKNDPPKGFDDEGDSPEISSLDQGIIEVIVDKLDGADLGNINPASISFGPYRANPFYAESLKNKSRISHWKNKTEDNKILYLKFNLSDLKIRCDLDKELVLNATVGDKKIVAAAKIKPVICTKSTMKKHAHRHGKKH